MERGTRIDPGVPGLDTLLDGEDIPERASIIRGVTGRGKTIFWLPFLAASDGPALFVGFAELTPFGRYLEHTYDLRATVGVLKRRTGAVERTLREFQTSEDGSTLGEPTARLRRRHTGTLPVTDV
ncbi:hypothetical protein [Halobaculum limi]|uniref:hypothetical protein n=1 Tax=Halobaculum limi TaxID=3031916 RepID=UPI002404A36D|nr:hypothetical protein [Halobaculum sp. YSMS11]